MFQSPLTVVGVVATLLSVVFAVAAWMNSRRRQLLIQQMNAVEESENRQPFGEDVVFDNPPRPASVFKKMGPDGKPVETPGETSDIYAWE